jgi:hypothetical protein
LTLKAIIEESRDFYTARSDLARRIRLLVDFSRVRELYLPGPLDLLQSRACDTSRKRNAANFGCEPAEALN